MKIYVNGVRLVIVDHFDLLMKTIDEDKKMIHELTELTEKLINKYNVKIKLGDNIY